MNVPAKIVSIRGLTLRNLTFILLFALAGVLLMALMGIYSNREAMQRHESFELNVLSRDIGNLLGFYRRIAATYANRQDVSDMLEFNDVRRAVAWAEEVRSFLPESIGVALIDQQGKVLGEPPQLHLGKQCVTDLKRILGGEQVSNPPVHRGQKTMQHFDITVPVKDKGELMGLLFMSFSLDILQQRLGELVGDNQYLLIVDNAGNSIAAGGDSKLSGGSVAYLSRRIPDTNWQLRYKGYDATFEELFLPAIALGVFIVVITIGLALYTSSRLLRLVNGELGQIRNLLDSVHKGDAVIPQQNPVSLRETASIMEDVTLLVHEIEQANRNLKEQSTQDPLTGLFNRRAFDEELERYAGLATRGTDARLVLLDLDNFKAVNDRYGHNVGDEVLIAFAETLHERCRTSDVLARIGGDEFALIMPGREGDIENWFRDVVVLFREKQKTLNGGAGVEPSCGLSAGSVVLDRNGAADIKPLLRQVDEKLYDAKTSGRGVIVH